LKIEYPKSEFQKHLQNFELVCRYELKNEKSKDIFPNPQKEKSSALEGFYIHSQAENSLQLIATKERPIHLLNECARAIYKIAKEHVDPTKIVILGKQIQKDAEEEPAPIAFYVEKEDVWSRLDSFAENL